MMRIGTSHFVSLADAVRYYSDYEKNPYEAVARKLSDGEIHIGRPTLKPNQELLVVDNGTRYAIQEDE